MVAFRSVPVATDRVAAAVKASAPFAVHLVKRLKSKLAGKEKDNVSLMSEDEVLADVKEFIPTGFPVLDSILGGGWAVGRASEVFGAEGSGKSALTHAAIVSVQSMGGVAIYLDWENALDPDKMEQLGIVPERLVYVTPEYIEQGWDVVWDAVGALIDKHPDAPTLIIWDSVAASIPKEEYEQKTTEKVGSPGAIARAMSKGCRKMFRAIARTRAHMMWVNQERVQIGKFAGFGPPPQETVGGVAIRYAASQRVRVARVMTLKQGLRATGYLIKVTTKKNRCAPPHQQATWVLDFTVGPSPALTALQHLKEWGVLKTAPKKDRPVESEAEEAKRAQGPKEYVAPWSKLTFSDKDWLRLLETHEPFARGAQEAYRALIDRMATATTRPDQGASEEE
jgi:protein RecA